MSTSKTDAKRAELQDLFERLSLRRVRLAKAEDTPTDASTLPKAAMNPSIIKGTSAIGRRPRRNTVDVASILATDNYTFNDVHPSETVQSEEGPKDAEFSAKFSLANEKKYPFTFKHMLHQLYNKDDWAQSIKEMLAKSKNQFKPLAEQEGTVTKGEPKKEENRDPEKEKDSRAVLFKIVLPNGTASKRNSIGGRRRSHSVIDAGRIPSVPLSPTVRSPSTSARVPPQPESSRALKKRCVGRRKSMSGTLNGAELSGGQNSRGNWVYDAAISASERPPSQSTNFMAFLPEPLPSPIGTDGPRLGSRYAINGKRRTGTIVRKRSVSASFAVGPNNMPIMMPLQQVTNFNKDGLAARRQRLDEHTEKEEPKKPEKRSFAA